jgi:HD-like signal output (HDOD) protein/CheY-like chemotaxis protein
VTRVLVAVTDAVRRATLRAQLPGLLPDWQVRFEDDLEEALATISGHAVDVVVAESRSPGFDDAMLLRVTGDVAPGVARVALTVDQHEEAGLRLSRVAHRCVHADAPAAEVATAVRRAGTALEVLDDATVRAVVAGTRTLSAAPQTTLALTEALTDPEVCVAEVAAIVRRDPAVAARILQLVNSAFFGRASRTSSVDDAVAFLGLRGVRGLVASIEVVAAHRDSPLAHTGVLQGFQTHGLQVASAVAVILRGHPAGGEGTTAGLLHDVGRLVLAEQDPAGWEDLLDRATRSGRPLRELELERFGTTHAEVGGALLDLWGLPAEVVDAVAHHHDPTREGQEFGLAGAVHAADAIVHAVTSPAAREVTATRLNVRYLEAAGVAVSVGSWVDDIVDRLGAGEPRDGDAA